MLNTEVPTRVLNARLDEQKDRAVSLLTRLGLKAGKASYPCPQGLPEAAAYFRDLGDNAAGYREAQRRMGLLRSTAGVGDDEVEAMQGELDHLLEVLARFGWTPGK